MKTCCIPEDQLEQITRHREIERELARAKRDSDNEVKLLLLGTGESGKTTFIKQMRIIHGSGFSDCEKRDFITKIHSNIIHAIRKILIAMEKFSIGFEDPKNAELAETIPSELKNRERLSPACAGVIQLLWNDRGVLECYKRRREYQLIDSVMYFASKIEEVTANSYLPTEEDILHVREPTTSINEYIFRIERYKFRMVDIGGQRSERRKWIHCFEDVTSILFLVSLSEYDLTLQEDSGVNRMEESKALFRIIINDHWFHLSSPILFLNKKDIFEEKIKTSHLSDYFPEYEGPECDSIAAIEFIRQMYTDQNRDESRIIYTHVTCATDTENMKYVFSAVKDMILRSNLDNFNISFY